MPAITSSVTDRCELLMAMVRAGTGEVRERALRTGAETLPEQMLVALLREDADDVRRNAGLEMLKLRGRRSVATAITLLGDPDHDVVLQAVLLLDAIGDPRAWPHLRFLLTSPDPNVVQAVITAAGHLGSRATAAELLPFLDQGIWLQMPAIAAIGQLRSRVAVPALRALLADADVCETAAEALARIGGSAAAEALADFWIQREDELPPDAWIPLVAQVLADAETPAAAPSLRPRLAAHLDDEPLVAGAAAAALLALGPGELDLAAIRILNASADDGAPLPRCLERRADLAPALLGFPSPARDWGYALARRHAACVPDEQLRSRLVAEPPADPAALAEIASRLNDAATLMALYLRRADARDLLLPLLAARRAAVLQRLEMADLPLADRILLMDAAGAPPRSIVTAVESLGSGETAAVVGALRRPAALARLPWMRWLEADPPSFAPLLGEVVARRRVRQLLPVVRRELERAPRPELISAAGVLRDRASVRLVIDALAGGGPSLRATAFESLASISGPGARRVLHQFATAGDVMDVRLATHALAGHPHKDDGDLLRRLAAHADWAVRHAAAEGLGRCPTPDNLAALASLAADPSAVVARRARGWLDAHGAQA